MDIRKAQGHLETARDTEDPQVMQKEVKEALKELRPFEKDIWIYRIIISSLSLVALLTVIGGILLAYKNNGAESSDLPSGIIGLGSVALGALAGLLAPSPNK